MQQATVALDLPSLSKSVRLFKELVPPGAGLEAICLGVRRLIASALKTKGDGSKPQPAPPSPASSMTDLDLLVDTTLA